MNGMKQTYLEAMVRKLKQGEFNLTLAVKAYPSPDEIETPELGIIFADLILTKIKIMTPRELIQLFPVKKEFDGNS